MRLNPFRKKVDEVRYVLEKLVEDEKTPESIRVTRLINFTALSCALIATQPIPFADVFVLTPVQVAMIYFMARAMKVPMEETGAKEVFLTVLNVAGWGLLAQHGVIALYKIGLPFLGAITTIPLVYAATTAVGCAAKAILDARRERKALSRDLIDQIKSTAFEHAKVTAQTFTIDSMKRDMQALLRLCKEAQADSARKDEVIEDLHNEGLRNEQIRERFVLALKTATRELDIMSPWVSFAVVNELDDAMEAALERGVTIKILYGMTDSSDRGDSRDYRSAKAADGLLERFARYGSLLRVKRCGEPVNKEGTHAKILICDESFYVVGSFNLLSFKGDYARGGREELAEYSKNTKLLRDYRKRYFDF